MGIGYRIIDLKILALGINTQVWASKPVSATFLRKNLTSIITGHIYHLCIYIYIILFWRVCFDGDDQRGSSDFDGDGGAGLVAPGNGAENYRQLMHADVDRRKVC